MIGNAFLHEWLWIDIGLAMAGNKIWIRLVMNWHLIGIGMAICWYKVYNGLAFNLNWIGNILV